MTMKTLFRPEMLSAFSSNRKCTQEPVKQWGGAIETMLYKIFQEKERAPPGFKSLTREVITNTQEGVYHLHFTSYWSGLSAWCMKIFSFYLCVGGGESVHLCNCAVPKGHPPVPFYRHFAHCF